MGASASARLVLRRAGHGPEVTPSNVRERTGWDLPPGSECGRERHDRHTIAEVAARTRPCLQQTRVRARDRRHHPQVGGGRDARLRGGLPSGRVHPDRFRALHRPPGRPAQCVRVGAPVRSLRGRGVRGCPGRRAHRSHGRSHRLVVRPGRPGGAGLRPGAVLR